MKTKQLPPTSHLYDYEDMLGKKVRLSPKEENNNFQTGILRKNRYYSRQEEECFILRGDSL